jgi:hypothetical protein
MFTSGLSALMGRSVVSTRVDHPVGTRVILEECTDQHFKAAKGTLWSTARLQRQGVVVQSDFVDSSETFCMIALDSPLNTTATDRERNVASKYIVERVKDPGSYLILIPLSLIQRNKVVVREFNYDFKSLSPDAMLCCQLEECKKGAPRRRLLHTCTKWNHFMCFEHVIPWDQRNDRPDLAIASIYHEQMVKWALTKGQILQGFETRVLLGFNYWLEGAGQADDQQTAVREFCEYDKWVCKLCKDTKDRSQWTNTNFTEIHKQVCI